MAEKKLAKTGKYNTATTWSPEGIPGVGDDVNLNGSAFNLESVNGKARDLRASSYTGTMSFAAAGLLALGDATAGTENVALQLGTGMTLTLATGATVKFVSTSATVQSVTTAGKTMPETVFEGVGAKYQLEDEYNASTATISHTKGEVKCNGKIVTCGKWLSTGALTRTVDFTNATLVLKGAGALLSIEGSNFTVTGAASLSYEVTDTTTALKEVAIQATEAVSLIVTGDRVRPLLLGGLATEKLTVPTVKVNTKRKPFKVKATLVSGSNHLTVTAEEGGTLEVDMEVTGTGIPTGTFLKAKLEVGVWEMSGNATETVAVAETVEVFQAGLLMGAGAKLTCTSFITNGTASEPARLACASAANPAAKHKISKASGRVIAKGLRLRNSEAEGGAEFYAPSSNGCVDCGGNTGWKFEDAPPVLIGLNAASSASAAALKATAATRAPIAAAKSQAAAAMSVFAVPKLLLVAGGGSDAQLRTHAPIPVGLEPSVASSGASGRVGTQVSLLLVAGFSSSAANGALQAKTRLGLVSAAATSAATAQARAAPRVTANASSVSSGALGLHAIPKVACVGSSASAAGVRVTAKTRLLLNSAAGVSSGEGEVRVPGRLSLTAGRSTSVASMKATAKTGLPFGAAQSQGAGVLAVRRAQRLALNAAVSQAATQLTIRTGAVLVLTAGGSRATGGLGLGIPVRLALASAVGVGQASLELKTRAGVALTPAFSISHTFARTTTRQVVGPAPATSSSNGSMRVYITVIARTKTKVSVAYPTVTTLEPA